MEASARSDIGLVRAVNEDSFLVTDVLFAVADGLGGHEAGEVASRMAIDLLEEHLPYFRSNPADKLRETFTRINTAIHQRSMSDENCKGMGTTLTALLIQDGTAYIGHVGDSRAYLVRDGQVRQLTQDHSYVNQLVVLGTLSQEEAKNHPQRNVLLRALGAQEDIEVDLFEVDFQPGDIVLLATDGLVTDLDKEVLEEILLSEISLEEMADRLLEAALASGGRDNVTVVLGQV